MTAAARRRAMRAVPTLMRAHAVLLDGRDAAGQLTPIQPMLLRCCLASQQYRFAAARVLDAAGLVTEVDPALTGVTQTDLLLYCYYGGTVLIGMHRYEDAVDLLVHALTSPTHVVNHITVCAFRRYVLASMLRPPPVGARGARAAAEAPPADPGAAGAALPRYTPSVVQRAVQQCCAEYLELERAYLSGDAAALDAAMAAGEAAFRRDGNWGTVSLLPRALVASGIRRLAQTYVTFPVSEVAARVRLPGGEEAERRVLGMVRDGRAGFARVNQSDAMLEFAASEGDGGGYATADTVRRLDAGMRRMMHLSGKVAAIDEAISCDPAFINVRLSREKSAHYARFDSAVGDGVRGGGEAFRL